MFFIALFPIKKYLLVIMPKLIAVVVLSMLTTVGINLKEHIHEEKKQSSYPVYQYQVTTLGVSPDYVEETQAVNAEAPQLYNETVYTCWHSPEDENCHIPVPQENRQSREKRFEATQAQRFWLGDAQLNE